MYLPLHSEVVQLPGPGDASAGLPPLEASVLGSQGREREMEGGSKQARGRVEQPWMGEGPRFWPLPQWLFCTLHIIFLV